MPVHLDQIPDEKLLFRKCCCRRDNHHFGNSDEVGRSHPISWRQNTNVSLYCTHEVYTVQYFVASGSENPSTCKLWSTFTRVRSFASHIWSRIFFSSRLRPLICALTRVCGSQRTHLHLESAIGRSVCRYVAVDTSSSRHRRVFVCRRAVVVVISGGLVNSNARTYIWSLQGLRGACVASFACDSSSSRHHQVFVRCRSDWSKQLGLDHRALNGNGKHKRMLAPVRFIGVVG